LDSEARDPHQPAHSFASVRGSIPALLATPLLCTRRSSHVARFQQPVSPMNRSPFGRRHPPDQTITRHTNEKESERKAVRPERCS
jgi:hypothetical protein